MGLICKCLVVAGIIVVLAPKFKDSDNQYVKGIYSGLDTAAINSLELAKSAWSDLDYSELYNKAEKIKDVILDETTSP